MFGRRKARKAEEREAAVQETHSLLDSLLDDDGVLTPDGLGRVFMQISEYPQFQGEIMRDVLVPTRVALARGGHFIAEDFFNPDGTSLLLREGEDVLYDCPAQLLKEVMDRELRGVSQGISVPLGHGVRYRVGAARGHMVTIGSHWTTVDEGSLTLTDQRLVYHRTRQTIEFQLAKLATLTMFGDAVVVGVRNRKTNSSIRVGSPELVAGLIHGAVSHLDHIVVMHMHLQEADAAVGASYRIAPSSEENELPG